MHSAIVGVFKAVYLGFNKVIGPLIGTVFSITEHQKITPPFPLSALEAL